MASDAHPDRRDDLDRLSRPSVRRPDVRLARRQIWPGARHGRQHHPVLADELRLRSGAGLLDLVRHALRARHRARRRGADCQHLCQRVRQIQGPRPLRADAADAVSRRADDGGPGRLLRGAELGLAVGVHSRRAARAARLAHDQGFAGIAALARQPWPRRGGRSRADADRDAGVCQRRGADAANSGRRASRGRGRRPLPRPVRRHLSQAHACRCGCSGSAPTASPMR